VRSRIFYAAIAGGRIRANVVWNCRRVVWKLFDSDTCVDVIEGALDVTHMDVIEGALTLTCGRDRGRSESDAQS